MTCSHCGNFGVSTFCGRCGAKLSPPLVVRRTGNAFTWPFHQVGWYKTIWMPLAWFILPGFGTLLSLGWAIDAIRRRARGDSILIPQIADIASFFKHGVVIFSMTILYFVIPVAMFVSLTEMSFLGQLAQLWALILDIWHDRPIKRSVPFFCKNSSPL